MLSLRHVLASVVVMGAAISLPVAGLAGCSSMRGVARYQPLPDLQNVGLRQLWERRVSLSPGEKIVHVWRVGDSIYATTSDGQLARINATVGNLAWQVDLGDRDWDIFRPVDVPDSKNLLVVNSGRSFLLDKQTGDIVMQKTLAIAVSTDPIVSGTWFCVGGGDSFHAIYLDTLGGQKWVTPAPGDIFTARPAVEADTAILASESGKLWRVNLATGDWMWKDRKANGAVIAGLASDGRSVYVPCLDSNVYAFDLASGAFLWTRPLEGRLDRALQATRSEVLVPASGKGIYALNSNRGDIKWLVPRASEIGTIVRDHVWVSDAQGNLISVTLDTGEIVSTTPTGGSAVTNNVDQLVILVNSAGVVSAYNPMK